MKNLFIKIILILIFTIGVHFAHEDHEDDDKKADTVTVVNGDTIAINGVAIEDSISAIQETEHHGEDEEDAEKEDEFKLNIMDVMFEHVHNKIIHFPISLSVAAFLFALFGYKDNRYESTIKVLLLIAGAFAIVAFFTGANQFDHFVGNPKEWLANTHRLLGMASAVSIWLWFLCLSVTSLKRFKWLFAIITVVLISVTGLYGGVLAH